jgi:outer membrane protein OmpA-like peptidoglycan-associated protein
MVRHPRIRLRIRLRPPSLTAGGIVAVVAAVTVVGAAAVGADDAAAAVPDAPAPAASAGAAFSVQAPQPTPESFGEHDEFPWLPPLPGSALMAAEHGDEGLDVTTADDAEPRIVGAARMIRRYAAPAGIDADAIVRAYAGALRRAGWVVTAQQSRAPGGALVVAHYAASGRDVWARLTAGDGHYEIAAADAGLGMARAFAAGCIFVANDIVFGLEDAILLPESESTLQALQRLLKSESGLRIEILAHTDARDANGDLAANLALSARRAEAVKTWLRQHRIDGDRITTRGAGASAPLHPSDGDENRARNRRVEIRKAGC